MVNVTIALDCCPTCGQRYGGQPGVACDAIKPGSMADVLPLRCTLLAGHGGAVHEAPLPGWNTSVTWATGLVAS